jgi:hypothetical protein
MNTPPAAGQPVNERDNMTIEITHGIIERPARIILCGVSKIGKSTWAAGAPNPVFLPCRGEEGIDNLNVARLPVASTFEEVIESIEHLIEAKHQYKTVVIDSVTTLEPIIWDKVCRDNPDKTDEPAASIEKVNGGFGKGYIEALKYWRDIMAALDYLRSEKGMGSILISHVSVKAFSDPGGDNYDTWVMTVNRHAQTALEAWSDYILFANSKTFTKTTDAGAKVSTSEKGPKVRKAILRDERVLFTQKRPHHPGGGRYKTPVPYEMELSYAAWSAAVKGGQEQKK